MGEGHFGMIWKGTWNNLPVAIKELKQNSSSKLLEFADECAVAKKIPRHPNVVCFYGVVCEEDEVKYAVSEWVEKGDLETLIKSGTIEFSSISLLKIMRDVAAGMEHIHNNNIIHRDLAARNILITENFDAKVGDFGLSRNLDANSDSYAVLTEKELPLRCVPPEVFKTRVFRREADVWSFGVFMWELCTGSIPYQGIDLMALISKIGAEGSFLSDLPPMIPIEIRTLFKETQQYLPEKRPSFAQIHEILQRKLEEQIKN